MSTKTKLRNAIRRRRSKTQSGAEDMRSIVTDVAADTASVEAEQYFDELTKVLTEMTVAEIKKLVSTVKKGEKGDKGDKGDFVKGKDGKDGADGRDGTDGKDGVGQKGEKGEAGKDGRDISAKDLLAKINATKGKIEIKTIKGLDAFLTNLQRAIREKVSGKHHRHGGGGMTIDAGSNITLTRNSNGRWTIASTAAGGSNILTERVTAVQSGDHVTIDLTQLAHSYTGVLFVTRNGQVLLPNGDAAFPGSSWSQSGDVITVYNADAGEIFLVQYMYA